MRRVRYSVAASLDGFIAGPNGEYDWIPMDPDIDFAAMAERYDTYLMGRRTWEASGGEWVADHAETWVFSTTLRPEDVPGVTLVADDAEARLTELRARPGRDVWLFGGGELFRSLLEIDQVDAVEVAVVPILLGEGIPLLPSPAARRRLALVGHRTYPTTGITVLEYEVKTGN